MPSGRPSIPIKRKDVVLIVKKEIEKALKQLDVKVELIGTKRRGRPLGSKLKKNNANR